VDRAIGGDEEAGSVPQRLSAEWHDVLAHRSRATGSRARTAARFISNGLTAEDVRLALSDGGDELCRAAASEEAHWADKFGGPVAAALLAAEVSALMSHLNSRAAAVRSRAVDAALNDLSAVTVAAHLGVSRQKVYDVARGGPAEEYIHTVPWGRQ
jgi:hypothetical protein